MRHSRSCAEVVAGVLGSAIFVVVGLWPHTLHAQSATSRGQVFAMTGPAVFAEDSAWYASGGFEYLRANGAGIGVETAAAWGFAPNGPGMPRRGTGLLNVYATGQRVEPTARVQPFVLGGVGFVNPAISDTSLALLFGAGAHVWLRPGKGLRLDLRVPLGLASTDGVVMAVGLVIR